MDPSISSGEKAVSDVCGFLILSCEIPIDLHDSILPLLIYLVQESFSANNFEINLDPFGIIYLFIKSALNPFVDTILTFFLDDLVSF